ncbi:MAG: hypothetical protein JWP57_4420 [Spirosoma sp.]|nr:hypothetical protein [Spirosoma sp.]
MFEQQLDFIWQQGDDIRQIGRPSHYAMVSLNGTQEEVTRLGPLLVDFLNANRTADEKPRAEGQRSDAKPNNNGQVDRL